MSIDFRTKGELKLSANTQAFINCSTEKATVLAESSSSFIFKSIYALRQSPDTSQVGVAPFSPIYPLFSYFTFPGFHLIIKLI